MDFVQGESLSRLVGAASGRGERIRPEMVATIMVGTLHGLHAAHEAKSDRGEPLGIVHRDVTPHNILVGIRRFPSSWCLRLPWPLWSSPLWRPPPRRS